MVHQWGFFGSISAIRKIWSLTANSRSLQAAALKLSIRNKYFLSLLIDYLHRLLKLLFFAFVISPSTQISFWLSNKNNIIRSH